MDNLVFLGDLHFGQAKSEKWTEDNQKLLIDDLYDYCKLNKVTRVIQVGDFFDNRKGLKHTTLNFVRENVVGKFAEIGVKWDVIVGNHDMFYKTNVVPNACDEILGSYDNYTIHSKPTTINIDGLDIDMIPWMCQDNNVEIMEFINNSKSKLCIGHFELSGFKYNQSIPSNGVDANFLESYFKVISGHFHTQSNNGTVYYIGTPYQLDFNDADDKRGWWVMDTETTEMKFVDSGHRHYTKLKYDEFEGEFESLTNMRVRLYTDVEDDNFKLFVSQISEVVDSLDIVYNNDVKLACVDESDDVNLEDTRSLVVNTINNLDVDDSDKTFIIDHYDDLYSKAME
jgi:DNA repair exonuclease SbcCD nuclease subunit